MNTNTIFSKRPVTMVVFPTEEMDQNKTIDNSIGRRHIDTAAGTFVQDDVSSFSDLQTMETTPSSRAHWEDDILQLERIVEEGPTMHDLGDDKSVHSFDLPDPDLWEVRSSFDCGNSLSSSDNFNLVDLEPISLDLTSLIAKVEPNNESTINTNSRLAGLETHVNMEFLGSNNLLGADSPTAVNSQPLHSNSYGNMNEQPQEISRQNDAPLGSFQKETVQSVDCEQQGRPGSTNLAMNMEHSNVHRRNSMPYQTSHISSQAFMKNQSQMQWQNQLYPEQNQTSGDSMDERMRLLELNSRQAREARSKFNNLSQNNHMQQYAYSASNANMRQMYGKTASMPDLNRKRNVARLQQFDMDAESATNNQSIASSMRPPIFQEIRPQKAFSSRRVARRLSNDSVASSSVLDQTSHSVASSSVHDHVSNSISSSLPHELLQNTSEMSLYPSAYNRKSISSIFNAGGGFSLGTNVAQSDYSNHSGVNANAAQPDFFKSYAARSDYSNHSDMNTNINVAQPDYSNYLGVNGNGSSNSLGMNANTNAARSDYSNHSGFIAHANSTRSDYSNHSGMIAHANAARSNYSNHLGKHANAAQSVYSNHSSINENVAQSDFSNNLGINANVTQSGFNHSTLNENVEWTDYSNLSSINANIAQSDYSNHSSLNGNANTPRSDYSNHSGTNTNAARFDCSNHSSLVFSLGTSAIKEEDEVIPRFEASAPMNDGKAKMGQSANTGEYEGQPVIKDSDRQFATAFSFAVLTEVESCIFGPKDITGKRVGLKIGFKGLACRHCRGNRRLGGRLFPSKIKTMSDTNKTLIPLFRHMLKCPAVSASTKEWLEKCKVNHENERKNQKKYGSQKAFFTKIWERLHGKAPGSTT